MACHSKRFHVESGDLEEKKTTTIPGPRIPVKRSATYDLGLNRKCVDLTYHAYLLFTLY